MRHFIRLVRSTVLVSTLVGMHGATAAGIWPDLSAPAGRQPGGEHDAAVIVAIEQYASVPSVPGATQNANDWYTYLVKSRGMSPTRVRLLRDNEGTMEKMRRFADETAGDMGPDGTLWFIFIGHGAPAKDGNGGVLVGYDAQQDADSLFARSLPTSDLIDRLNRGRQAQTVVVVDACFSGRSTNGESLVPGLQPLIVARQKGLLDAKTIVMTAGKSDQFAGPLPGTHRPAFSYLLLGALRGWGDDNRDGHVTAQEAVAYTRDVLRALVTDRSQTPELNTSQPDRVLSNGAEQGPDLSAIALTGAAPVKNAREATAREHLLKGQLYVRSDRLAEAEAEFHQAEQLAPDWDTIQTVLAEVTEKLNHYDDALRYQRWLRDHSEAEKRTAIEDKIAALSIEAEDQHRTEMDKRKEREKTELEHRQQTEIELQARRDTMASSRRNAVILGVVGGAFLAGAGVFAYLGSRENSSIKSGGFSSGGDIQSAASTGSAYNVVGYSFLALGVAIEAISIPWYLSNRDRSVSVTMIPTGAGGLLGARGHF